MSRSAELGALPGLLEFAAQDRGIGPSRREAGDVVATAAGPVRSHLGAGKHGLVLIVRSLLPETHEGFDEDQVAFHLRRKRALVGDGDLAVVTVERAEVDLLAVLDELGMIEEAGDVVVGPEVLDDRQVREVEVHLDQAARSAVVALGDLVGFLGRLGAAVAMNLKRADNPADLFGRAFKLKPVFCCDGGRRVVVVHLNVDLDSAGFFLRADQFLELGGFVAGDETEDVAKTVFLGEATVLGCDGGGDTIKAGGGDGFDFTLERPFLERGGVANEGPEVGDVGDLGHGRGAEVFWRSGYIRRGDP